MGSVSIIVAVDFAPASDRAVDQAIELARLYGGDVELVHVHRTTFMAVPPATDGATLAPSAKEVGAAETALVERVHRVRAAGIGCEGHATFGRPAEQVVRRALEHHARLVLVGRSGHGSLRHMFLGSVAEAIVQQSPCPVVVVPPNGQPHAP